MKWMRNVSIKYKVPIVYTATLFLLFVVSFIVIFSQIEENLNDNIKSQLDRTTKQIESMIRVAAETSIRNELRSLANVNESYVAFMYDKYEKGLLTESDAKKNALEFVHSQAVGSSGYIYVMDSTGVIVSHPSIDLIGVNISEYEFVQQQLTLEDQYIQYDWKNPGENVERPKALYMTHFEPWDWVLSVSTYRDEFTELIQVEDFESDLNQLKFGQTGYSFVIDLEGNTLIHPFTKGVNIRKLGNGEGENVYQQMIETRDGIITYQWSNTPDEPFREKIAVLNYLPEYEWIIASSGYMEEFNAPIRMAKSTLLTGFTVLLIAGIVTISLVNRTILTPMHELIDKIHEGADGQWNVYVSWDRKDEFGLLGQYFNEFMFKLNTYHDKTEQLISEKEIALNQIKLLNDSLEDKVKLRTDELYKSIDALKETQQQLMNTEKMSTAGQVVSGLAHRLNTPLGTAITMVSFLSKDLEKNIESYETGEMNEGQLFEVFKSAETGLKMTERNLSKSAELIEVMKSVSGLARKGDASEFFLQELLHECLTLFPNQMRKGKYPVSVTCPSELVLVTSRGALIQVFTNLLSNAFKHAFHKIDSGHINISVHELDNTIEILFTDDGKGIEPEYVDHVFDPFYRFETIAKGSGLGLYIVHTAVVDGLNGEIECDSSVGRGTRFKINLPKQNFK